MAVDWKISISVFWIIVAAFIIFIFKPFYCASKPSATEWTKLHTVMTELGYKPAKHSANPKPDTLPPEIQQAATSTVSSSGYWIPDSTITVNDTLEVELSTVMLEEEAYTAILINDKNVIITKSEYYYEYVQRRWTLHTEIANAPNPVGMGIGYRIWQPWGVNVSPAVTVSTRADWIAGELRLSRNIWSGVAGGVGVGYRLGDEGLHLSAGVSLEL